MKRLMKKLEDIYAAVAFAEAGEAETSRKILREEKPLKKDRIPARPPRQLRPAGAGR